MLLEEKNEMFNLELFINRQDLIWTKYDSLEQGLDILKSEKDFINNFDRYIIQTLEEIYEVSETYDPEEIMKELVDILMYLGTMYAIVRENAKTHCCPTRYNVMYETNKDLSTHFVGQDFNELTSTILFDLMSIRRLFGKRKWHKYSEELSDEQKLNTLDVMEERIRHSIKATISYLLDYASMENVLTSFEYVEKLILEKQDFVINLKGKNE